MRKGLVVSIIIVIVAYLGSLFYYQDKFGPGSEIGGVGVSGLGYDEALNKIKDNLTQDTLIVKEGKEVLYEVKLVDLGNFNYERVVEEKWGKRNQWILSRVVDKQSDYEFIPVNGITGDEFLKRIGVDNSKRKESKDAYIDDSFKIVKEFQGTQIDSEVLYQLFSQNREVINLSDAYLSPDVKTDNSKLVKAKEKIDRVINQKLTLNVKGNSYNIPSELIYKGLIYNNEENKLSFDSSVLNDWLDNINNEIMPYGKTFEFDSTLSGKVTVPPGTLGWAIDIEQTLSVLKNAILSEEQSVDAILIDDNYDLSRESGSYIEVDLTHQKMFVYINGNLQLETDIVSGMAITSPPTPTVPGAYQVWNMESPSVLRGTNQQLGNDYAQPVNYWIPFDYTGQGIHDANWQPVFGGDVYLYGGSQGCINTPPNIMPMVYDLVEIGFPVMIFGE